MTIFEIFEEYGLDSKRLVDEDETKESQKTLFYDFKPFNSKDPILLSGMNRPAAQDPSAKKWSPIHNLQKVYLSISVLSHLFIYTFCFKILSTLFSNYDWFKNWK